MHTFWKALTRHLSKDHLEIAEDGSLKPMPVTAIFDLPSFTSKYSLVQLYFERLIEKCPHFSQLQNYSQY